MKKPEEFLEKNLGKSFNRFFCFLNYFTDTTKIFSDITIRLWNKFFKLSSFLYKENYVHIKMIKDNHDLIHAILKSVQFKTSDLIPAFTLK